MSIIILLGAWLALSAATVTLWVFAASRLKRTKEIREGTR